MRIISGHLKGRVLKPSMKGWQTRPTTDMAKEGLFNILMNELDFESVRMLDLFGGTGNHSFEFLSRGCQDVTYVDHFHKCAQFVEETATDWGCRDQIRIVKQNVAPFIRSDRHQYGYIFAGPPYPLRWLADIPRMIFESNLLEEDGLFVLEHHSEHQFTSFPDFVKSRHYGHTHFSFFRHLNQS